MTEETIECFLASPITTYQVLSEAAIRTNGSTSARQTMRRASGEGAVSAVKYHRQPPDKDPAGTHGVRLAGAVRAVYPLTRTTISPGSRNCSAGEFAPSVPAGTRPGGTGREAWDPLNLVIAYASCGTIRQPPKRAAADAADPANDQHDSSWPRPSSCGSRRNTTRCRSRPIAACRGAAPGRPGLDGRGAFASQGSRAGYHDGLAAGRCDRASWVLRMIDGWISRLLSVEEGTVMRKFELRCWRLARSLGDLTDPTMRGAANSLAGSPACISDARRCSAEWESRGAVGRCRRPRHQLHGQDSAPHFSGWHRVASGGRSVLDDLMSSPDGERLGPRDGQPVRSWSTD